MKRRTYYLLPLLFLPAFTATGCAEAEKEAAEEPTAVAQADEKADDQEQVLAEGHQGRRSATADEDSPAATAQAWASPPPAAAPEAEADKSLATSKSRPSKRPAGATGYGIGDGRAKGEEGSMGRGGKGKLYARRPAKEIGGLDNGILSPTQSADMVFQHYGVNPTVDTEEEPKSTFAVDVDTASYTMTRSFLDRGQLPAEAAVRVEEVVNSFNYNYEPPSSATFSIHAEAAPSPNRQGYHVLHVGVKGKEVAKSQRKAANLVFVVDVSGSMSSGGRLDLVKRSLPLLVNQLDEADTVGIVSYGSKARTVIQPTTAYNKRQIIRAIEGLRTEGATNAEAGLKLGYQMASRNLRRGGVNRVILCSDGVANVGATGPESILEVIGREVKRGITMTSVGVGMGNYNDVMMERLADKGNGNYFYIDKLAEARKVFVDQLAGTLQFIAKDVKIQVQFDPTVVQRYRLIGYENRKLRAHQFNDDRVDAGEIGAGHSVTALYEVKLNPGSSAPLGKVRIRYKQPTGSTSQLVEQSLVRSVVRSSNDGLSSPTQLSLVAAQFAEKLRGSYWARNVSYDDILRRFEHIASPLRQQADVVELRRLVTKARDLDRRGDKFERHGPIARMDFDRVPVLR
ncbi:MAG: VWA domain-containing protein [Deltaproteobacteria bacterium]|nr:VWA domain-containing protein [Deltaproteobacteria bacterium]